MKIAVTDANVQDRDGLPILLKNIKKVYSYHRKLKVVWVDGGYQGPQVRAAQKRENITVDVIKKPKDQKGFAVLPRRWVVERSFSWLEGARRLDKDHEIHHSTHATWIAMKFAKIIANRIK